MSIVWQLGDGSRLTLLANLAPATGAIRRRSGAGPRAGCCSPRTPSWRGMAHCQRGASAGSCRPIPRAEHSRGGHSDDAASHLPAPVQPRLHLCRRRAHRALSGQAGRQPPLRVALPEGAGRQHPRLRHHRSQRLQPRDRRRCRLRRLQRQPCTATGWGRSSTSCPTTWASATTTTPGGSTSWSGARNRSTPSTSTSTGTRPRRSCAARCWCPSLGEHYGRVLEAGELKLGFDAEAGTFSVWYYEHRFPITPGEYPRILRVVLSDYGRLTARDNGTVIELEDLSRRFPRRRRLVAQDPPAGHPPRRGRRPEAAARPTGANASRRSPTSSTSRSASSTAARAIPRACCGCTSCWKRSTTGWPTGGLRPRRSTTAGSSRSTIWPASGSSCRRCSRRSTSWCST